MMEVMYDIPSMTDVDSCIISSDVIRKKQKPVINHIKKSA
jgi:ATP-dependent protease Clp ATPase subunit